VVKIFTFFLLFLVPFIVAPFGTSQFENPKVIVAELGVIAVILHFILTDGFKNYKIDKHHLIYILIIALSIIHLVFFKTELSVFGNGFRMQGIFLLWILLAFSYLSFSINLEAIDWRVFVVILFAQTIMMFFMPLNESGRYVGTIGEPNSLAAFAVFTWPFGWFALGENEKKRKLKISLLMVPVIVILFFSSSRSAMIALLIQLMFLYQLKRKTSFKKAVSYCLFLILISYSFPFLQKNIYENRVDVWKSAVFAGTFSPIVGNGFGNLEIALDKAAEKKDLPIQYYYFDSSHNIFLDWWVQGGALGLISIIALVYFTIKKIISKESSREFILLTGMLTCLSFNPVSIGSLLGFWWLMGKGFGNGK
jgi:O-antigen ligase